MLAVKQQQQQQHSDQKGENCISLLFCLGTSASRVNDLFNLNQVHDPRSYSQNTMNTKKAKTKQKQTSKQAKLTTTTKKQLQLSDFFQNVESASQFYYLSLKDFILNKTRPFQFIFGPCLICVTDFREAADTTLCL